MNNNSWIPKESTRLGVQKVRDEDGLDLAVVTQVPGNENSHMVECQTLVPTEDAEPTPIYPSVVAPSNGEVSLPSVGDVVALDWTVGDFPIVVGKVYSRQDKNSAPIYDPGERVIGNDSDTQVRIKPNGDIVVEQGDTNTERLRINDDGDVIVDGAANDVFVQEDGGGEIKISGGTITLNNGTQGVITDVSASTTEDSDGHVTSVSINVTRESTIQI